MSTIAPSPFDHLVLSEFARGGSSSPAVRPLVASPTFPARIPMHSPQHGQTQQQAHAHAQLSNKQNKQNVFTLSPSPPPVAMTTSPTRAASSPLVGNGANQQRASPRVNASTRPSAAEQRTLRHVAHQAEELNNAAHYLSGSGDESDDDEVDVGAQRSVSPVPPSHRRRRSSRHAAASSNKAHSKKNHHHQQQMPVHSPTQSGLEGDDELEISQEIGDRISFEELPSTPFPSQAHVSSSFQYTVTAAVFKIDEPDDQQENLETAAGWRLGQEDEDDEENEDGEDEENEDDINIPWTQVENAALFEAAFGEDDDDDEDDDNESASSVDVSIAETDDIDLAPDEEAVQVEAVAILAHKKSAEGRLQFLVQWQDPQADDNATPIPPSWEEAEAIKGTPLHKEYLEKIKHQLFLQHASPRPGRDTSPISIAELALPPTRDAGVQATPVARKTQHSVPKATHSKSKQRHVEIEREETDIAVKAEDLNEDADADVGMADVDYTQQTETFEPEPQQQQQQHGHHMHMRSDSSHYFFVPPTQAGMLIKMNKVSHQCSKVDVDQLSGPIELQPVRNTIPPQHPAHMHVSPQPSRATSSRAPHTPPPRRSNKRPMENLTRSAPAAAAAASSANSASNWAQPPTAKRTQTNKADAATSTPVPTAFAIGSIPRQTPKRR